MSDLAAVLSILMEGIELLEKGCEAVVRIRKTGPYGFIHKSERITYDGMHGTLVWDYILWNELTFEDDETHEKYTLATKFNDEEMEKIFNEIVKKCK